MTVIVNMYCSIFRSRNETRTRRKLKTFGRAFAYNLFQILHEDWVRVTLIRPFRVKPETQTVSAPTCIVLIITAEWQKAFKLPPGKILQTFLKML